VVRRWERLLLEGELLQRSFSSSPPSLHSVSLTMLPGTSKVPQRPSGSSSNPQSETRDPFQSSGSSTRTSDRHSAVQSRSAQRPERPGSSTGDARRKVTRVRRACRLNIRDFIEAKTSSPRKEGNCQFALHRKKSLQASAEREGGKRRRNDGGGRRRQGRSMRGKGR
jgi:hypothetical protein